MVTSHESVAIVGIGLRLPGGARTPEEFAGFLRAGRDGVGAPPAERADAGTGGYLERIDEFDPAFFGMTPAEARYTDPTQRLLLETAWEALENAAIDPTARRGGNGGVYVGAGVSEYAMEIDRLREEDIDGALAAGITPFALSGRLSYFLDWRGPSMTVDTAGASSLTALHQAVVGLRRGECDIALCASANTLHNPRPSAILAAANVLSGQGRCRAFDDDADGYVRAEGAGAVVLKRLADAQRDGDRVLAVVRGSAVGQDGDGPGISVPNGAAQERVILAALADAGLAPADVTYVEAHGLGTPLGDPIELGAIADVFADAPVTVASVKTNIGHLEPAAGLAGLVKTVLQLRDGQVYPHLNFQTPSARVPWDRYPITIPTETAPWTAPTRRAVVNSFGFGGTIAVAVLEQAPAAAEPTADDGGHVFTLSAKNRRSLRAQVERFRAHLDEDTADLCYTAAVGRAHFPLRVAGVVHDREQLAALLDAEPPDGPDENAKVAFLFDDAHGAAPDDSALRGRFSAYREAAAECGRAFAGRGGDHAALFTTQYALARLWLSWGVKPGIMLGRGVGEIVAATISGLFTVQDAATLVAAREDGIEDATAGVRFNETALAFVAALSGKVARRAEITKPDYWVRQATAAPDLAAARAAVERRGAHVFLELGPPTGEPDRLACLGDDDAPLRALAELYRKGVPVRWADFYRGRERRRITLPTYGFDRKRFWLPSPAPRLDAQHHPLLGVEVGSAEARAEGLREFRALISPEHPAYLADHVVAGQVVFPGAGYIEILLALQDAIYGDAGRTLSEVRILEPLFLTGLTEIRTRVCHAGSVEILSVLDGGVTRCHATAMLGGPRDLIEPGPPGRDLRVRAASTRAAEDIRENDELYPDFAAVGMGYGPQFQRVLSTARHGADFAIGDLRGEDTTGMAFLPPPVLDGALHTVAPLIDDGHNYLPVRFGELRLFKKPKARDLRVLLRLTENAHPDIDRSVDLLVLEDEQPVAEVRGLGFKRLSAGPAFLHRAAWVKRSQRPPAAEGPRHVLLVNGDPDAYAGRAAELGVRLSTDPELIAEATDVCWFWRPGGDLAGECAANLADLRALAARLTGQRLWLVTERAQWLPGDTAGDTPDSVTDDTPAGITDGITDGTAGSTIGSVPGDTIGSVTGISIPGSSTGGSSTGRAAAATAWGHGRALGAERPDLRVTLVDLPTGGDPALVDEWAARDGGEFQLAYRDGHRHVRRLLPVRPAEEGNTALAITAHGRFADIKPVPVPDELPSGGDIQVRVQAAGLNFKDVLNALGMLKQHAESTGAEYQPQPLGFECAGTVLAAGPTAEFQPGDEVIVNYPGLMRHRVTVPSATAVAKPARLGWTEAAGQPSAYVTAHYALHHLAGMKAGDRVLIHAAAGGVGQAAVQLAKAAGAEVFATASPHKWPVLAAQGVTHLMNSRDLDFAEQVRAAGGVDIVLNSLNKEFIPAGLGALRPGGRFVELGKVDVWAPEQVAANFPGVRYHNFDFSELPADEAVRLNKEIMLDVTARLAAGELDPVTTTGYSLDEVEEAFGVLSRGANVGKLVLRFTDPHAPEPRPVAIRPDRTYVVTGGLSGLGLRTAARLAALGAGHLLLVDAPDAPDLDVAEPDLSGLPATAHRGGDLAAALSGKPPVGGVVHAANGFAEKVHGGVLLHEADLPELDFFVAYRSLASVLGVADAEQAAADEFLDHLVHQRARAGLPALGIAWGPVGEETDGLRAIGPAKAMRTLTALLSGSAVSVTAGQVDWADDALRGDLARPGGEAGGAQVDLPALLALPAHQRLASLDEFIRVKVAEVLRFPDVDDVGSRTKFARLGLDSLVAVELKNALEAALGVPLPAAVAFDHPTALQLAQFVDTLLVPAA
ncbi:type I polyketide synthase [Actinokineospora sp. 24-640]